VNYSELVSKKVAGIPVLYLAGAAVIVLAIVAWRMKPSADFSDAEGDVQGSPEGGSGVPTEGDDPYAGLETNGTVTVVQQPPAAAEPVQKTNEDWAKEGAEWAVTGAAQAAGIHTTGAAARAALNHFLYGEDLSYEEGQIVNAVIREKGQPPEGVGAIGKIPTSAPTAPSAPAQKQFTNYPGTHTVRGSNDNTFTKLSVLYYGSSYAKNVDLIAASNLGINRDTPIAVGTRIAIPYLTTPKYFTATSAARTASSIASKNGITVNRLNALNPGRVWPVKVGTQIRVG
jgi:hypothetical protein